MYLLWADPLFYGLLNWKNRFPAAVGRVTLSTPLPALTELVTRAQVDGGERLVVEYKLQVAAQAGQFRVKVPAVTAERVKAGAATVIVVPAAAVERPSETVNVTG